MVHSTQKEYHWIYRFVVKETSIRLMDESCGYIEHVDDTTMKDNMAFGLVSGRSLGATLMKRRRKEKERTHRSSRWHGRDRRYRHRPPLQRDDLGLDSSVLPDDCIKRKSLLDEQDDEEETANSLCAGGQTNEEHVGTNYNLCEEGKRGESGDKNYSALV